MELKLTLISLLVIFSVLVSEIEAGRRRKIIIHVPVKLKKEKHTHTFIKPVHVHHKSTIIKEEVKPIIKEIHKPIEIHKEIHHKPIEIHKPVEFHKEIHEYKKPKPIYKEEISHEHLHHHYKHVHPDVSSSSIDFGNEHGSSYAFSSSHP